MFWAGARDAVSQASSPEMPMWLVCCPHMEEHRETPLESFKEESGFLISVVLWAVQCRGKKGHQETS